MCSARAAEALREPGLKAGDAEAGRETIAVGRQLGVVLLEYVQPPGGPLYGFVRTVQLFLPLSLLRGTRDRLGLVPYQVDPLGEPYVAFVVLQVQVVLFLKELGRGAVPDARGHLVVQVWHFDSQAQCRVFGPRRRFARDGRLRYLLPPLL